MTDEREVELAKRMEVGKKGLDEVILKSLSLWKKMMPPEVNSTFVKGEIPTGQCQVPVEFTLPGPAYSPRVV